MASTACGTSIKQATAAGEPSLAREDILFFGTLHEREVSVNSTRVTRVLGTDVWDLTYAEWESRRQLRQLAAFFRRYVPGFEKAYLAQSGVHCGVRETRRIMGEYQLSADDVLEPPQVQRRHRRAAIPWTFTTPPAKGRS